MANLALVANSTTHATATNTRDALVANGHTVTLIADSTIASVDFSGYDAIVGVQMTNSSRATIAAELRDEVDGGKPLFVSLKDSGPGDISTLPSVTTVMGLTGEPTVYNSVWGSGNHQTIEIVDNGHPITAGLSTGALQIHDTSNWIALLAPPETSVGTLLANGDPNRSAANYPALFAIEQGTDDLNDNPINARVVVWGNLYAGQSAYNANGEALIGAIMDWLLTPPTPPAAEIEAETLLQLTASATIEAPAPASIAAATYLQLTTGLTLETPAHIAAAALLQLTASATVTVTSATLVGGEAILQLVATADVQQEHLITAESYLQLVATTNLQLDDSTLVAGSALLELVGTLATATAHHVRSEALLQLVATTAVAQDHLVRAATLLQLVAHEGYTGPGTGIVVPGQRFSVNALREGDTFRVVLPWAGIAGVTGLAHVNSRTLRDDRHEQDLNLHIEPLDRPNIPALAGGARPIAGADQQDYARKQARQGRELDRIERDRNR